ncbi:hypothetical protein F5Y01DRAFT_316399 [Xylaria sp. FL0043]|nr:hypothetical protein F5Y01DRAFT_316399 [Xylaria sp. FL0043]
MSVQSHNPTTIVEEPPRSPSLPPAPPDKMKIANAPEDIVRAVLIALCEDPSIEQEAMSHFSKLEKFRSNQRQGENISAKEKSNDGDCTNTKRPNKRRAISEIAICVNCKEPFSADDNGPDVCRHHPGEMELNDEGWVDCDDYPPEFDPRYSKDGGVKDNPEGYTWDCCEQFADAAGCSLGWHEGLYKKPHGAPVVVID